MAVVWLTTASMAFGQAAAPAAAAPAAVGVSSPATSVNAPVQTQSNQNNPAPEQQRNQGDAQRQNQQNQQNEQQNNNPKRPTIIASTEFQQMVSATTGRTLPIFGMGLFEGPPSTFAPLTDVPVPSDYVIGPGDVVQVQLFGQDTMLGSYAVDRNGNVSLPEVGPVQVAGLHYSDLENFLRQKYSVYYKNFGFSATLSGVRSIQIYVTGQGAVAPGSYTVSSLSTLVTALFAVGGPLSNGSMRDIQVVRGGASIVHFDLYDFLLRGDKSKSIKLLPEDTIVIPIAGPQVAIVGSVNAQAIYELKGETSVPQLLELAGGETAVAAGTQVRVERVFEHRQRSVVDVDLNARPPAMLQNGDIVSVTSVLDRFGNAVTLRGNVANPGRYVWHLGMHVSDLIPNKDSLVTRNYFAAQNQLGQLLPQGAAGAQVPLSTTGTVNNLAQPSNAANGAGSVGTALTQNNSPFAPQNDVVLSAPDIDWSYAVIERLGADNLKTTLIPFNLGRLVLQGDQSQNLELLPGDVVTIFSTVDNAVPIKERTRFVRLEGEFSGAGLYSVQPGETLRQLIARAGGLTSDAYLFGAEFTRQSEQRIQRQRLLEYADELDSQIATRTAQQGIRAQSASDQTATLISNSAQEERAAVNRLRGLTPTGRISLGLKPESTGITDIPDLSLEDGDRLVVPHRPDSVRVQGQVYNASAFVYHGGWNAKQYLEAAGGPNRNADKKRVYVLRADGSVVSNQYSKLSKAPMYPGDTIVMPQTLGNRSIYRNLVDAGALLSGFGVPLTTLYLLSRQ